MRSSHLGKAADLLSRFEGICSTVNHHDYESRMTDHWGRARNQSISTAASPPGISIVRSQVWGRAKPETKFNYQSEG